MKVGSGVGRLALAVLAVITVNGVAAGEPQPTLLWGDTHLHTSYSFDAFLFNNRDTTPDTAYRYAKGLPVLHPMHRGRIQIETPLDFLVVSDHAEITAVPMRAFTGDAAVGATEFGRFASERIAAGKPGDVFKALVAAANGGDMTMVTELNQPHIRRSPWQDILAAADRHNQPGVFTAFIGWEWSSTPDGANLHRIIVTDGDSANASQYLPYSSLDSQRPEDLWAWLEQTSQAHDSRFVSIPHNMNISKGLMFDSVDSDGAAISADYATTRARWEPIAEVTQIKGDSETHPRLSPSDEFADFERYRFLLDTRPETNHTAPIEAGAYVRSALLRGLELEQKLGINPYKFGMIGSTDSHTSMASAEETNFHGKMAYDGTPESKSSRRVGDDGPLGWDYSASGLTAVWAGENSRSSILNAFQRKEVYATTGTRIALQFFAGWSLDAADLASADPAAVARTKGVPMGGDLTGSNGRAPKFMVLAARDANGANLDRIQIVKGWLGRDGTPQEQVFDVALSPGRNQRRDGGWESVGNTVDISTASYTNNIGAAQLSALWQDPNFDPAQRAFYYARVLEIPTPRHSLYDFVALQQPHPDNQPTSIQERAYSSPIWYTPAR